MNEIDKRIDDFLSVVEQKGAQGIYIWENLKEQLHMLCETKEQKKRLDDGYAKIIRKNRLAEWDDMFTEATINTSEVAHRPVPMTAKATAKSMQGILNDSINAVFTDAYVKQEGQSVKY